MSEEVVKPKKKIFNRTTFIIFDVLLVVAIIFVILSPSLFKKEDTRTIMIYMSGNDLETDVALGTVDLKSFDPARIDLTKTNVILYTGGTKKWHNFVSNDGNAIYKLTKDGFQLLEQYDKLSMGKPETLSYFLNYAYDNFKTTKYVLVLYNHGAGSYGAIGDEITKDMLSLDDFSTALKNSPFNSDNKLEGVIFRTCLNGTVEVANTFKDYSKYLVASEEVTRGNYRSRIFNPFNDILPSDDMVSVGKKYIDNYAQYMSTLDNENKMTTTYSITDLSKIDELDEQINKYFNTIDLNKNYNQVASIRSKIFTYGDSSSDYFEMIDLYSFVEKTKSLSSNPNEADKLLNTIKETVKYSYSNKEGSNGLSIYFPFGGNAINTVKNLAAYDTPNNIEGYSQFVKKFVDIKNGTNIYDFMLKNDEYTVNEKEISYKLSDEEAKYFADARVLILQRDREHQRYYYPLLLKFVGTSFENNTIKVGLNDEFIKFKKEDGNYQYIYQQIDRNGIRRIPGAILSNFYEKSYNFDFINVYLLIDNFDNNVFITRAEKYSKNDEANAVLLDLDDYDNVEIYYPAYLMYNEKEEFVPFYEAAPVRYGVGYSKDDGDFIDNKYNFRFEKSSLVDGDFYAVFVIRDINGKVYYSDMIEVGD